MQNVCDKRQAFSQGSCSILRSMILLVILYAAPTRAAMTSLTCAPAIIGQGETATCTAQSSNANETGALIYTNGIVLNGLQPMTVSTNNTKTGTFTVTAAANVVTSTTVTIAVNGTTVSFDLTVNPPTPAASLVFYRQNESDTTNVLSQYWLSECGGEAQGGPGQQTFWACLPSGWSSCSGSVTLTEVADIVETGGNPNGRLSISPTTASFNTMGSMCCANIQFMMNSDSIVNAQNYVDVVATYSGAEYSPGAFRINFRDDDLSRSDWRWELDAVPYTGGALASTIPGRIFIDNARIPYLCHVSFTMIDEDGSANNAYTNVSSPYYVDPTECQPTTDGACLCTQASWNLKYPDDAEDKELYYPNIPHELDIVAYPNPTNWPEGNCIPVLCVRADTERDNPTGFPNCDTASATITPPSVAAFFYPTFVLMASYDHLHNFYDNNASADGSTTDLDTDNFNKIIMVDANLFPIHTALRGDQEYPNVVMRNWSSGVGVRSPSVNDYMNRSVAALPDYLAYTSLIFDELQGGRAVVQAVGMRSHMQWVYALDPANNNFRRYKFIKIPDYVPSQPAAKAGTSTLIADATQIIDGTKCATCDSDYWYTGTYLQAVAQNKGTCPSSCWNDGVNSSSGADTKFLMFAKTQDGNSVTGFDAACSGPMAYFTIPIPKNSTGNITVSTVFYGFKHDNSASLKFYLNPSHLNSSCKQTSTFNTADSSYTVNNGTCANDPLYVPNGSCRNRIDVSFANVPATCADASPCDENFCYMEMGITPCGNNGGWVLEVPGDPKTQDNAFQVSTLATVDPDTWKGMNETAQQKALDNRWATIDYYLDTVPPQSYPGYPDFTSLTLSKRAVGFGFESNTSFTTAKYVRFNDPRDIDAYRDYFDVANEGPAYIFVADSGNSRIQVFMNATGSAGDVGARAPIRPVPVKLTSYDGTGGDAGAAYKTNEVALRLDNGNAYGHGRPADLRGFTTVDGVSWTSSRNAILPGALFYPHSVAVDQDPDTRDVYLFVADTHNHRIQIFRDHSGVSLQPITGKRFDFRFETGFGTYPLQDQPGPFNYRYPKGLDIARFGNNSSYLYVVDSKNYRVLKYEILEHPTGGIASITPKAGYGYDGAHNNFLTNLTTTMGTAHTFANTTAGFSEPQDVATGYSGFFIARISGFEQTVFLNNYMVYVTDPARNTASTNTAELNMRVMQFIDVPGANSPVSDVWIPWETDNTVRFGSMKLGQSVYGISPGVYNSTGAPGSTGSTNNAGAAGIFTDRPFGIAALQWNTQKPIDIRVVPDDSCPTCANPDADAYVPLEDLLPLGKNLRIGVSSRVQRFKLPIDKAAGFWNASTVENANHIPPNMGRWDGMASGRVHIFCYNAGGFFKNHIIVPGPPYAVMLTTVNCAEAGGFVKMVAEDLDVKYSARSGTAFYQLE